MGKFVRTVAVTWNSLLFAVAGGGVRLVEGLVLAFPIAAISGRFRRQS